MQRAERAGVAVPPRACDSGAGTVKGFGNTDTPAKISGVVPKLARVLGHALRIPGHIYSEKSEAIHQRKRFYLKSNKLHQGQ